MREGGGAVAPVKIDPPHSFPTFSPREVCYHERGWGEEEEEDAEEGETRVTAQGVSRGLPSRLSLCIHISGSSRAFSCAYMCVCIYVCVRARMYVYVRARAPRWEREGGQAHVGARGQIRGAVM